MRGELDGGAAAGLRRVLARAAPGLADRLEHHGAAGPPRVFPGLTGYLRDAAGPGWALVGDAGYFKDPITAHGITDALRDAEILARVVVSGGPDAVGRYQAERDELSLRLFRVTGRIAAFDWTADEIGAHLLELNDAMAGEIAAMTHGHWGVPRRRPRAGVGLDAASPPAPSSPAGISSGYRADPVGTMSHHQGDARSGAALQDVSLKFRMGR